MSFPVGGRVTGTPINMPDPARPPVDHRDIKALRDDLIKLTERVKYLEEMLEVALKDRK
jgi:hypothetical protein